MKSIIILSLVPFVVWAGVSVNPGKWDFYSGTEIIEPERAIELACIDSASAKPAGEYGCRTITHVTVTQDTLPLVYLEDFDYLGGFRIKKGEYGKSQTGYSNARIAYNPLNHSLFFSGKVNSGTIGEFPIPALVKSYKYTDFKLSAPIQNFQWILPRVASKCPTEDIKRIGGMIYHNGELIVHGYDVYDANADNVCTTAIVRDPTNLQTSNVAGFFKVNGKAHVVNWASPLDEYWKEKLGADIISGGSIAMSINSRLSMGPSMFALNSQDFSGVYKGAIPAKRLMDFSVSHIMAPVEKGWVPLGEWQDRYQYNPKGDNDLFTQGDRGGWYGIVLPGSRTYAVFGRMGMALSGGGYKITNVYGDSCGGSCTYLPGDVYNYYWFFDMIQILEVKNGTRQPYEVKPYSYGVFPSPFKQKLGGGTFDPATKTIYLSQQDVDKSQSQYTPQAVVVGYTYSKKEDYSHLLNEQFYTLWIQERFGKMLWKAVGFDQCVASGDWSGTVNKLGWRIAKPGTYQITCVNNRTGHSVSQELAISGV